jgi:hypothetical protein
MEKLLSIFSKVYKGEEQINKFLIYWFVIPHAILILLYKSIFSISYMSYSSSGVFLLYISSLILLIYFFLILAYSFKYYKKSDKISEKIFTTVIFIYSLIIFVLASSYFLFLNFTLIK